MIINLFTKQLDPTRNRANIVMKTNSNNNSAMNQNRYFNAEQMKNFFAQLTTVEKLREVAGGMVAEINAAAKARFMELKPVTTGATTISMNAPQTEHVEEAQAEEVTEDTQTTPKAAPKTTAKRGYRKSAKTEDVPKTEKKAERKQVKIASLTKEDIKKMDIHFYQYSEKCVLLRGETKCIKDDIMEQTGSHSFRENYGWFLKSEKGHALAKAMGCRVVKDQKFMKKAQ